MDARDIINTLGMQRHPEGGWYVETFRDDAGGERGHSTAIYFLLEADDRSHWHRVVDAVEVWHYHAGAPLILSVWREGDDAVSRIHLGSDLAAGERPQGIVPRGAWQAARSTGEWTLVGCTVSPGFQFSSFELAPPDWEPPVKEEKPV